MTERPWLNEPSRVEFRYKGYDCLIQRVDHRRADNPKDYLGHLCGYVAIPPGHPYHGKSYDDMDIEVHGGLTYGNKCQGKICHVPQPGESDDVFWIGFDMAHSDDLIPGMWELRQPGECLYDINQKFSSIPDRLHETYKTIGYVKNEIRSVVKQLIKAA